MQYRAPSLILVFAVAIACSDAPTSPAASDLTGNWHGNTERATLNLRFSYAKETVTCSDFLCGSGQVTVLRLRGTFTNVATGESTALSASCVCSPRARNIDFTLFPTSTVLPDTVSAGGTGATMMSGHVIDGSTIQANFVTINGTNRLATALGASTTIELRRR